MKYHIRRFLVAFAVPGFFSLVWLAGHTAAPGPVPGWALLVSAGVPLCMAGSTVLVLHAASRAPRNGRQKVDSTPLPRQEIAS